MLRTALILVLIPFSVLSAIALWQHGYIGLFTNQFINVAGWQVLSDLIIAVSLCMLWMYQDAKKTGRNVWPWMLLALIAGSFGPLLYLITAKKKT